MKEMVVKLDLKGHWELVDEERSVQGGRGPSKCKYTEARESYRGDGWCNLTDKR